MIVLIFFLILIVRRVKLNANVIGLLASLSDSDLKCESRDNSDIDRDWKPKASQNVGESDFSDSDEDFDQITALGTVCINEKNNVPIVPICMKHQFLVQCKLTSVSHKNHLLEYRCQNIIHKLYFIS